MKLDAKKLLAALRRAAVAAAAKSHIGVLECIQMHEMDRKLQLVATDCDVQARINVSAPGAVAGLAALVNAKEIVRIVGLLSGALELTIDAAGVSITSGRRTVRIPNAFKPADFPFVALEGDRQESVAFQTAPLQRALTVSRHASAALSEDRRNLYGAALCVNNGNLYAVATDGVRIAEAHIEAARDYPVRFTPNLPRKIVEAILATDTAIYGAQCLITMIEQTPKPVKAGDAKEPEIVGGEFKLPGETWTWKDPGAFPAYEHVFPRSGREDAVFSVPPALREALKFVLKLGSPRAGVRLSVVGEEVGVHFEPYDAPSFFEAIPARISAPVWVLANIRPLYLLDALSQADPAEIRIRDTQTPVLIRSGLDRFLVMPMKEP